MLKPLPLLMPSLSLLLLLCTTNTAAPVASSLWMPIAPAVYLDPGLLTESGQILLLKYCGMAIVGTAPWNAGPFDDDWFLLQVPFHISKRLIQITVNKEMRKRVHFTPSANRKSLLNVWIVDTLYANAGKWDIGVSQWVISCGRRCDCRRHPYFL